MRLNLRLRWEVLKEAWPYIKANPIHWLILWWALRKMRVRGKDLDRLASLTAITRLRGETDIELKIRVKGLMMKGDNGQV